MYVGPKSDFSPRPRIRITFFVHLIKGRADISVCACLCVGPVAYQCRVFKVK
jgi:hypothetical protein